jgi:hypothetical protein
MTYPSSPPLFYKILSIPSCNKQNLYWIVHFRVLLVISNVLLTGARGLRASG